jgi:nitric oxide reductase subunit B
MVGGSGRRQLLVSSGWVQAAALTLLFGFFLLGLMGYKTYSGQPPIPEKVTGPAGNFVFTGEDVRAGQKVFLRNGLMQYGSVFGHRGTSVPTTRPTTCVVPPWRSARATAG